MKARKLLYLLFLFVIPILSFGQNSDSSKVQKLYKIEKNDGTIYIGKIISQDAREVLLETQKLGQIYIPKHEIKSMTEIKSGDLNADGEYRSEEIFATRYFLTTNSLPIEKGESYIKWNLLGPDFQFGVGKNFSVGVLTSWIASPIVASAKYSFNISEKFNLGLGTLIGTGSWASPQYFLGLPFATATLGDRRANLNFSAGYGFVNYKYEQYYTDTLGIGRTREVKVSEGRLLLSIAGMIKIGKSVSIIFDSYISPATGSENVGFSLLIPGLRFQTDPDKAFQFGFAGVIFNDGTGAEMVPFPIPTVSWFRKLK